MVTDCQLPYTSCARICQQPSAVFRLPSAAAEVVHCRTVCGYPLPRTALEKQSMEVSAPCRALDPWIPLEVLVSRLVGGVAQ
jgi:hypothetical protein